MTTQELDRRALHWYRNSRRAIKRVYGKDWKLMCALLACTSPRSTIAANVALARKAYNQILETGTVSRTGFIRTHYLAIVHYLETGTFRGRKVSAFYQNLIGNETPVTVDVWMLRQAGLDRDRNTGRIRKAPTGWQYDYIESRVQSEATDLGITPAQWQAQLWSRARGNHQSYAHYFRQLRLL